MRPSTAVRRITIAATSFLGIAGGGAALAPAAGAATAHDKTTEISIALTPKGCAPDHSKVSAGDLDFTVVNKGAGSVSEVEVRTADFSHILGEQENLTPGLSGGFTLQLQPGKYVVSCPGASTSRSTLTVTGTKTGASWQSNVALSAAVTGYTKYIDTNVTDLVSHTKTFCNAVSAGNLTQAEDLYPQARIYYERIEPVAEIWGALDIQIDGRWQNPVTVKSQFIGFHRLEQMLFTDRSLTGAPAMCTGLIGRESQLLTLVKSATYNPQEMAAGSTDLVNEAATSKITGEEERYSNTDLIVLQANLDAANEVVTLFTPYLKKSHAALLATLTKRYTTATATTSALKSSPGVADSGYLDYSKVTTAQRRTLSAAINAYAETLSQLSAPVSTVPSA